MTESLREATKEYPIKGVEIAPISVVDAEIISEVVEVAEKFGVKIFRDIVREWKNYSDSDIRDLLRAFNFKFKGFKADEMVRIGEYTLKVRFLVSLKLEEGYDGIRGKRCYDIVVNEDPSERMMMCNTHVNFVSRKERDMEYKRLEERLEDCNITFL